MTLPVVVAQSKFGTNRSSRLRDALQGPDLRHVPVVLQLAIVVIAAAWVLTAVRRVLSPRATILVRNAGVAAVVGVLVAGLISLGHQTVQLARQHDREVGPAGYTVLPERFVRDARRSVRPGETWALVSGSAVCAPPLLYQWLAFRLAPRPPDCSGWAPDTQSSSPAATPAYPPTVILVWYRQPPRRPQPDVLTVGLPRVGTTMRYAVERRDPNYVIARLQ